MLRRHLQVRSEPSLVEQLAANGGTTKGVRRSPRLPTCRQLDAGQPLDAAPADVACEGRSNEGPAARVDG